RSRTSVAAASLPPGQFLLDDAHERLQWLGSLERPPIDEERRGPGHPQPTPVIDVALHTSAVRPTRDALLELRNVEVHLLRVFPEVVRTAPWRIGVERVMVLPELALIVRAPCRLRRRASLRMQPLEREITIHELHLPGIPLENLLDGPLSAVAEGTVEVGELHQRHG